MKVRTFDDEVLTLEGSVVDNIGIPSFDILSTAQFKCTPEQFEKLKRGISKVRLSMTPENHERTFKKDKMGKKLYKQYLQAAKDDF